MAQRWRIASYAGLEIAGGKGAMSGLEAGTPGGGAGGSLTGGDTSNWLAAALSVRMPPPSRLATQRKICTTVYSLLAFDDRDSTAGPQDVDGLRAAFGIVRDDGDDPAFTALDMGVIGVALLLSGGGAVSGFVG